MANKDAKPGGGKGGKQGKDDKGGKGGKGGAVVTAAALTVLALAGGAVTGRVIAARAAAGSKPADAPAAAGKPTAPYGGDAVLRELPAIVTNFAEPAEMRIRLQLAIVYPKGQVEQPDLLAGQVTDDIVAFVKTLTVTQLQGASGLLALREDLNDRARTRSDGKVREVVIENLVVQ